MTAQEMLETVANGENSGVEFNRENVRPEHLAEEIVAFANFEGGMILIGVTDDGVIEGVQRTDTEQWLMNICSHKESPDFSGQFDLSTKDTPLIFVVRRGECNLSWSNLIVVKNGDLLCEEKPIRWIC